MSTLKRTIRTFAAVAIIAASVMLGACASPSPPAITLPAPHWGKDLPVAGLYTREEISYFLEIAIGSEYGNSAQIIKKWTKQIRLAPLGNPTSKDMETISEVVDEINLYAGRELIVVDRDSPNVKVYFVPHSDFKKYESNYVPKNLGFMWSWWGRRGAIKKSRIMISATDIGQNERSHLIREELTQALGLMNDSWRYEESIFYQGWTDITTYHPIDTIVIEMLYLNDIKPGMSFDEAKEILIDYSLGRRKRGES